MKLPFFYPEDPEFKADVEYVAEELMKHANDGMLTSTHHLKHKAEARARNIVLYVTSRPMPWWKRLLNTIRGRRYEVVDDMFEQGLERWLREAVERAKPEIGEEATQRTQEVFVTWNEATDKYRTNLLRELGLDENRGGV